MICSHNPLLGREMLPADIVLAPQWWYQHENITFDRSFFFHPARRVEAERQMERGLYERWGRFGLGEDKDRDLPQVGAVHLAAGFMVSEMLGCRVEYRESAPPLVVPAGRQDLFVDVEGAFKSQVFRDFETLTESLKTRYGYLLGDVNWGGILNVALDLRGEQLFMDMYDRPDEVAHFFSDIAEVIERFVNGIESQTGSSSISVNRTVHHLASPVYLPSECSHTMISVQDYERFLQPFDMRWSEEHRAFGIHYCGPDPHRYAQSFAAIPHLDFLDVGWGGDVAMLRKHLPATFLNLRLSPVRIPEQSPSEIEDTVVRLVRASGNPLLTGLCCINMDETATDEQVAALFETVEALRRESQECVEQV